MLISFSGNTGSGKTHLSLFLYERLSNKKGDVIYVKEFQYLFLDRIKKFLGNRTVKIQKEVIKKRNKNIVAYLLPYIVWFDYFVFFNLLTLFRRQKIIIVDRYTLDYLNTWIELGVSNKFITFLYKLLPRSTMPYYIDVDPDVAFARFLQRERERKSLGVSPKHNLNPDFYQRNREIYKRLLKENKYIIIDGNQSLLICEKKVLSYYNKFTSMKK